MKKILFLSIFLGIAGGMKAEEIRSGWKSAQEVSLTGPGLTEIKLSSETIQNCQPGFSDLRIQDELGKEIPYIIEQPLRTTAYFKPPLQQKTTVEKGFSILQLTTGFSEPVDGIQLISPGQDFLAAVRVEGSKDGKNWKILADGLPVYRQSRGENLTVFFPSGTYQSLRIRTKEMAAPVPFTGALLRVAAQEPAKMETLEISYERSEEPAQTRFAIKTPLFRLLVNDIEWEAEDPLFVRGVTVFSRAVRDGEIAESPLCSHYITRTNEAVKGLSLPRVPISQVMPDGEIILVVHNAGAPPLTIGKLRAHTLPFHAVFYSPGKVTVRLYSGNSSAPMVHYDLAALQGDIRKMARLQANTGPLQPNPVYVPPAVLPTVSATAGDLDVSAWSHRSPVSLPGDGIHWLELPPRVLAGMDPNGQDLRLMKGQKQVPYILDRKSIYRNLPITTVSLPAEPRVSRWQIDLPMEGLPVVLLTAGIPSVNFQRTVTVYEDRKDERGQAFRVALAGAQWSQRSEFSSSSLGTLSFSIPPKTNRIILEMENGDNQALALEDFKIYYKAVRLFFKSNPGDAIALYYGNPNAAGPRYDMALAAGAILTADKTPATLGDVEDLHPRAWWQAPVPDGAGKYAFWAVLVLVAGSLLFIIARLLPEKEARN